MVSVVARKLTSKEQAFVYAYAGDAQQNGAKAAVLAGYAKGSARVTASKLLKKANVRDALANIQQQAQVLAEQQAAAQQAKDDTRHHRAELSAARVLEELRRLSFSNVQSLFDTAGNLKPIQDLTPEEASCIASFEVIKKNAEAGDGKTDVIHKLKVWDKTRSLEMLAKHFVLLTDVVKVEADDANIAKLLAGRARAKQR